MTKSKTRTALSAHGVEAAKTTLAQEDHFDALCPGLSLRVTKAGKKTWNFTFTSPVDAKRARFVLGTYPALALKDARLKAVDAREKVEAGKDPRAPQPIVIEKTVAQLIEDRLAMEVREQVNPKTGAVIRPALRTADKIEARFTKEVIPVVGSVLVKDFRTSHFNMVLDPIRKRGAMRVAGIVGTDLKTLFDFAVGRGELEYSPIAKAKFDTGWKVRERWLTPAEIATVWNAVPTVFARSLTLQRIVRLLLLTGQRLGEVAGMHRSEIDEATRVWTIPKERAKNGHAHPVPLGDAAWKIVHEAMRATNGDWLFPSAEGDGPYNIVNVDSSVLKAQQPRDGLPLGKFGIPHWTPHDLRRTVVTQMLNDDNGLEITDYVVSMVVNHRSTTKGSVTNKHYNMNKYEKQMREALTKWEGFIARLTGENVVQITGRAA